MNLWHTFELFRVRYPIETRNTGNIYTWDTTVEVSIKNLHVYGEDIRYHHVSFVKNWEDIWYIPGSLVITRKISDVFSVTVQKILECCIFSVLFFLRSLKKYEWNNIILQKNVLLQKSTAFGLLIWWRRSKQFFIVNRCCLESKVSISIVHVDVDWCCF